MNNKIFNSLANGGKFTTDQNKKTIDLFNQGKNLDTKIRDNKLETFADDNLDFFGYDDNNSENKILHEVNEEESDKHTDHSVDDQESETSDDNTSDEDMENNNDKEEDVNDSSIDLSTSEAISAFRKRMKIRVEGGDIPAPISSFNDMIFKEDQNKLKQVLLNNIEHATYNEPTPIQMQSIPCIYHQRDILASAPTGSGKTAAYLLPLVPMLNDHSKEGVRCIVLSPSHELCCQIQREWIRLTEGRKFKCIVLTKSTVAGYINTNVPIDIIISTPLRLVDAIENHHLNLTQLKTIIFDEADKLFEENFIEQFDKVLALCNNKSLQRIMFSATLPESVENLARTILHDPIRICIELKNTSNQNVKQELIFAGKEEGKLLALRQLFQNGIDPPVIIFVQSKERAQQLYHELAYDGLNIDVIHSDRPPQQREIIINKFRIREIWILICTDLVARGLDFKGVNLVINYDFPQSGISYIHRIGRTGRAGKEGHAITYFTEDDYPMLRSIANVMKLSGCDVPDWMLKLKKLDRNSRKRLAKGAISRQSITTVTYYDKKNRGHKNQMIHQNIKNKTESKVKPTDM